MPNIVKNRNRFSSANSSVAVFSIGSAWGTGGATYAAFSAPTNCVIDRAKILSNAATTGQTTAAHYNFQLTNVTQSLDLLSTAQSTVGNDIVANTGYKITPDQNNILTQDDVLQLKVTTTGSGTGVIAYTGTTIALAIEYRPA